jgi:hypothetical protein
MSINLTIQVFFLTVLNNFYLNFEILIYGFEILNYNFSVALVPKTFSTTVSPINSSVSAGTGVVDKYKNPNEPKPMYKKVFVSFMFLSLALFGMSGNALVCGAVCWFQVKNGQRD